MDSVDERTRKKLLKGHPNHYRLKIHHYRILFSIDESGLVQIIVVDTINTRTNIKY